MFFPHDEQEAHPLLEPRTCQGETSHLQRDVRHQMAAYSVFMQYSMVCLRWLFTEQNLQSEDLRSMASWVALLPSTELRGDFLNSLVVVSLD